MTTGPEPDLDLPRLVEVLNRHGVDYLIVGGSAATLYGATRGTRDLDCVPDTTVENLARLARAMRELNARLRVAGLTDTEAKQLPTHLDATTFRQLQISTWRTDAGDLDVLADIPNRLGDHLRYEDLMPRALVIDVRGQPAHVAALTDIIASKEWADRPKDHQALPELRAIQQQHPNPGGGG